MQPSTVVCWLAAASVTLSLTYAAIDPATTLQCHRRKYTYTVSKPYRTPDGEVLPCEGIVTVNTCWGRCDSSEIADYKVPFKISSHPVCTYSKKAARRVRLADCHPDHPNPIETVFDAVECACQPCSADDTSCENLNG